MKNNIDTTTSFLIFVLIYLVVMFFATSCAASKRTKPCNQCPQYSFSIIDTIYLTIPHSNYNQVCYPEKTYMFVDETVVYIDQL